MSGKSAKKKRLGSRRVAPNQNVSSHETHVTDDSSVAQHHALEEGSESLNVSFNPDDSKPETQQTPSPEATMSRRKLGSSRRNKGRQFAKASETEPYLEHREEVEEKTRGNKTVETTQTSLAAQLDRQEESRQGSVQDISATPSSSLSSANTPDYYYSEVTSPSASNSPEDVTDNTTPKPGNLQADQARDNETKQENNDKSDTPKSAEMEKNVGIPEIPHLSSLPSLSAEQQLINTQLSDSKEMTEEELSHVYSVPQMGSNKNDDADLFRQDESLQGNTLESDSQVGSVALESDTDKSSHGENTAIKDNIEQTIFLLPKEELPPSEKLEELFNLSELRDDQRFEDTVTKVHEQDLQATQMQKVDQDDYSPESRILDATEKVDISAANLKDQAENTDVNQVELSGKVTDDFAPKQEVSNPDDKQDEHPIKADSLEADFKVVFAKSVGATLEGVDKSDTGTGGSEDDVQNVQEEEGQKTEMQKMQQIDNLSASATDDATDLLPEDPLVNKTQVSPFIMEISIEEVSPGEHAELKVGAEKATDFTEVNVKKTQEEGGKTTEMLQIDNISASATDDATDNSKIIATLPSEVMVKSIEDSATKQEVSNPDDKKDAQPTKEDNLDVLDQISEDNHRDRENKERDECTGLLRLDENLPEDPLMSKTQVSPFIMEISIEEVSPGEHPELEFQAEKATDSSQKDNLSPKDEQLSNVSGTQHSEDAVKKVDDEQYIQPTQIQDEQQNYYSPERLMLDATENVNICATNLKDQAENTDVNQVEVSGKVTDDFAPKQEVSNPDDKQDEHPIKADNLEADFKVVFDKSVGATLEGVDKSDTGAGRSEDDVQNVQEEEGQKTEIQKMQQIDNLSASATDDATDLLKLDENLPEDPLVRKTQVSPFIMEISIEEVSPGEHPELEFQAEKATDFTEVNVKKTQEVEGKTTDMLQIDNISASATDDATDNSKIIATLPSEVLVKSIEDSVTKQEVSTPIVKQDAQPTKEDNLEVLDQISEDNPSCDTKTTQISDIERVDTPLVQVSEAQSRVEDDVKHNPEQMLHHEMEQLLSQTEDSKSSQSFQSEINVVSDSQPHDSSAAIDEKTSTGFQQSHIRRKLGSRRRNKGKQQIKDNEPTEEADGNTKGHEPSETTEIPLTSETADQEKSTETMLEGMNRSDTHPNPEENTQTDTHVCTSELTTTGKHSSPTVDKQVIDLLHCTQMPDEDLLGVHSVTDTENKERDECTGLLRLDENLPEDPLMSKTQVSPFIMEISIEEVNPGEHTELEVGAEKATDFTEVNVKKMQEEEGKTAEMLQIDNISASATDDATDNSKIVEVITTLPSEVMVPEDPLVSKTQVSPFIMEISIEEVSPGEHTELKFGNEKATDSSQKDNLSTKEEQLSNVSGTPHSEDAIKKVDDEQDIQPTQIQDDQQNDYPPESLILLDATEKVDTSFGNLKDQTDMRDTNQSELSVKITDDSAPQEEVPNPDDKQDERPTQERRLEVSDQRNEDSDVHDSKQPLINNTEREDTAVGQVNEGEGQVDDVVKHKDEQAVQQDNEGVISDVEKSTFSPQTLLSEIDAPFDSNRQDTSASVDEQTNTGFDLGGNRRKLGSSRRKKERKQGKESKEEVLENATSDEGPKVIATSEEDFKEMPDKSVGATLEEIDTSDTVAHQSEDNVKKTQEEEGKTAEMLQIDNISANATDDATDNSKIIEIIATLPLEVMVESIDDSATKEEVSNPDDRKDAQPTKEDNLDVLDQISEDNPDDTKTPQTSDIERVDTPLVQVSESEGTVEDDVKLNPEQTFHQEAANLLPELEDIKSPLQSSESETHVASDPQPHDSSAGIDEETITDNTQITEMKNTSPNLTQTNRRRKMGSTRRNLGSRNKGEDFDNEATETRLPEDFSQEAKHDVVPSVLHDSSVILVSTPGYSEVQKPAVTDHPEADLGSFIPKNENLHEDQEDRPTDFKEMSDKSVGATLESSPLQSSESETNVASDPKLHDSSAGIDEETNTGFQQRDVRRKLGSSRRNKGKRQFKEADENKIDHEHSETTETPSTTDTVNQEKSAETMLEGMNKPDTHQTEEENRQLPDENLLDSDSVTDLEKEKDEAQHLEDAVKKVHDQEIKPIQMQEMPQTDNTSVSVIDDATNITETFIDLTDIRDVYLSKLAVKSTDYDKKEIDFESSDQGKEADHVSDTKKSQLSDTERTDTALGDYVSESQVKDDIKSSAGKTGHQEAGLISEMGDSDSSLQSLQHELHSALDSKPQQNNTSFDSGGNTRKLGSSQEKSMETMLEGKDKSDSAQIKDTVHVKQNEYFGPLDGISEFSSSAAVDRQQVESNSSEMPDEELPITSDVTENKEKDENTEFLRQDGRSLGSDMFSESHVESESKESPTTMEITTEKSSSREHAKVESSVEQSSESAPKKELALSGEQNECFNPFEVTGPEQSEDVINKVHEELINPIQGQELLQIDTGPKICLQALPSEINTPLDSQQDEPKSIKDESPTGPNPAKSRRKLGSSRRNKGKQHAKEDAPENTRDDEASTTPNISLATETARKEELTDIKSPEEIRKISSNVNEDENTEKLPDKDSTFSTDSSTVVTADNDFLKSNKDVDDKDKKPVKEDENISHLIGYDKDKIEACVQPPQASVWKDDSHMQNISHHGDTVDIVAQEEASQPQNTEDLLRQDIDVQQTNDVTETVGHVMMESSVDKQGEIGQNFEDSTNKTDADQEINTSNILISTAQERVEDVESGISTAMDASNSQEENPSDYKKTLQVKPNQKRRKLGSTRRNQLNRKPEGETDDKDETTESQVNTEADVRNLGEMQDVKELVLSAEVLQNENATTLLGAVYKEQQEGNEISSAHDEGHQPQSSTSNLQSSESNVTPGRDDLMALLPEPSASHTEEAVDPDRKDGGRNVVVGVEPLQPEEFTSSKTQITPVIAERNRRSLDQLLPLNTDTTTNTGITGGSPVLSETTQNDDERAESATEIQDKVSTQQKPNIVIEEAQVKIPEMKSASPNLTPTNRRRKMGSTRRNLGTRNKGEDLDNEARETEIIAGDVKTESVPGIKEKELQLHTEHNEGDPEQERLLDTVEKSQAGEYQSTPPTQQTDEKNPVSQGELLDTEQQTSDYLPFTSTKNDTMSMSASGGKRRKMGSHRKSRGHQGYGEQTEEQEGILAEQSETNVGSIPEEGVIKPYEKHKEEPLGLQNVSEGDDRDKKPSSSIIISKPGEHSSEKTPFQPSHAENRPGQEQFSLGDPRGLRSDSYHVVMIGDSSVGKTSFMKRAQTGKFSLNIPSSIGLDSCMWTVVVDGKPVVLELWDTAGQERFRSITRHIFHRAQAFLLMYDITCTESFSAVSYWANCIQESAVDDVIVLLLGNKSDCAKRQVKSEQGEILAKEYNFEFMECSAATGENVVQCLETVARMLNQKFGTIEEAAVVQHTEAGQQKRSTCC